MHTYTYDTSTKTFLRLMVMMMLPAGRPVNEEVGAVRCALGNVSVVRTAGPCHHRSRRTPPHALPTTPSPPGPPLKPSRARSHALARRQSTASRHLARPSLWPQFSIDLDIKLDGLVSGWLGIEV